MYDMAICIALQEATEEDRRRTAGRRKKAPKGKALMHNKLVERCVGCEGLLTLGTSGGSFKGTVMSIKYNWPELETKKQSRLINTDYISATQIVK